MKQKFLIATIISLIINIFIVEGQNYEEIFLPPNATGENYTGSIPRDIIYAEGKIFVYTVKKIIVFNSDKSHAGTIEFDGQIKYGRFALKMFDYSQTATDFNYMFYHSGRIYYLTPNLSIKSFNPNDLSENPITELNAPNQIPSDRNKTLYVLNKFEISGDELIWFIRTKAPNYHSWDSYIGIYSKTTNGFNNTPIFFDFQDGSDEQQFDNLISTYGYNVQNKDLYVARSLNFEIFHINNNNTVTSTHLISTQNQRRFSKFLLIDSFGGGISKMLALPFKVPYDTYQGNQLIFQFDLDDPSNVMTVEAPNARVMDAVFISTSNELVLCYPNDAFLQIFPNDVNEHDISVYTYNTSFSKFVPSYSINTQLPNETDVDWELSINQPFMFFKKNDNALLLSKKNEIVLVEKNSELNKFELSERFYSKDNYFTETIQVGDYTYTINNVIGRLECLDENLLLETPIKTSFPVYNTEYNPQNRVLYLFNRLSNANSGFFVYDLDNPMISDFIEIDHPIGDLAYNSELGHVLISEFSGGTTNASIRVFDANNGYNELSPILISNANYPSEIFCPPNGKIYISLNMLSDNVSPEVAILWSSDYNLENKVQSGLIENYGNNENKKKHYTSIMNFCFNPYNESVYFTVTGNYSKYPPYQLSAISGYYQFYDANQYPLSTYIDGKLREITKDNELALLSKNITKPGEIICAKPDNPSKDYMGKLYINGEYLYSFDCESNQLSSSIANDIIDIDYNSKEDCLYMYEHEILELSDPDPDQQWIKIHKVSNENEYDPDNPLFIYRGIASSINYNEYDNKIYLHYLTGDDVLGSQSMKIIAIDANTGSTFNIQTQNKCLFPEVVPVTNYPFFDPYTNKAYFPNGMHSNISVFEFTPNEKFVLSSGENWISIPRLTNNSGTDWNESDVTEDVFNVSNFENAYSSLNLEHHYTNEGGELDFNVEWNVGWNYDPNEDENKITYSYRGYKLNIDPADENFMYLSGNIKDPATSIPLYQRKNNWVGYFLLQEQDIFDALDAMTLDKIDEITAQYFYCYRDDAIAGPIGGHLEGTAWICDQHQTSIKYGEMVQLKSRSSNTHYFQWQNPGHNPREKIRPEPTYFTYDELGAYTPIIIELDYPENPLEIGAFANNECVGAEAVMPADSIIILKAYLNGSSVDDIVFQDYFDTKSSGNYIDDYKVYNPNFNIYEDRILKSDIGTDLVKISFKKQNSINNLNLENGIKIWPNPVSDVLNYSFINETKGETTISLYNVNGKLLGILYDQVNDIGIISGSLNLRNDSYNYIKPGLYLLKIKTGETILSNKIVIH